MTHQTQDSRKAFNNYVLFTTIAMTDIMEEFREK